MRYRLWTTWDDGDIDLMPDRECNANLPVVHVFRDDELDQLADAILDNVASRDSHADFDDLDRFCVADLLRTWVGEPGSTPDPG